MTAAAQQRSAQTIPSRSLADLCREAAAKLERARREQPARLSEDVDEAERAVAQLRDELIDRLRSERAPDRSARTRAALNSVNAALSLIVGVEYPAAGIQRSALAQARDTLRQVLEEGSLG